jgi:hypothetical protein
VLSVLVLARLVFYVEDDALRLGSRSRSAVLIRFTLTLNSMSGVRRLTAGSERTYAEKTIGYKDRNEEAYNPIQIGLPSQVRRQGSSQCIRLS